MSAIIKDMGNKESIKQAQQNDTSLTRDGDLKTTSSVRGSDNYTANFKRIQNPNAVPQLIMGSNQSSMQGDKNKLDVSHLKQPPTQLQTNVSLQNSSSQEIMSHPRENFLQNYANLPSQPVINSGYINGSTQFSGQMIPPMVVRQPMQVPAAVPGMFQTGFMYQTLSQGSSKPNYANSHFFPPFMKGSLIMLATGNIKPIEELKTVDFIESAKVSKQLCLETSIISKIQDIPNSTMSLIGFAVEHYENEVLVEKPSEHPFFIFEQGWASCKPDLTLSHYGLPCQQLKVGNVCIFLSNKLEMRPEKAADSDTKSAIIMDTENSSLVKQLSAALGSQNTHETNVLQRSESGNTNTSCENEIKTQLKSFRKKEKDESLDFGQPAEKKAKLDVTSKNIDGVKS